MLALDAVPAGRGADDMFDLSAFADMAAIITGSDGCEHLAISDGYRRIRLDVQSGTLQAGPVDLRYRLHGFAIEARIRTLRRLIALRKLGRFARSLSPHETHASHWILALRTYDAVRTDASYQEIARVLFGRRLVDSGWDQSPFRTRMQRLVRAGRQMVEGGYRALLR